jgi:AcrR family transcriptional regulator
MVTTENKQISSTAELVLARAVVLFSTMGFEGTSMRQIASAVGIQPASLYNHYRSKEEILWEIVQRSLDTILMGQERAFASEASTVERLGAFVRMHIRFHAEENASARVVNSNLGSLSKRHYALTIKKRAIYEHRFRELLRSGVTEGLFAITNPKITSYAILEMGMGVATWFSDEGELTADGLLPLYEELALRMVGYKHGGVTA